MSSRLLFTLCLLFCIALLAGAAYLQYAEGLEPCPMCIMQRWGIIALCILLCIAIVHNPAANSPRWYGLGITLLAGLSSAVAGRQVWLQHLPAEQVPECGPGLNFLLENFPLTDVLGYVLNGSGECAVIDWTFLGQSLAVWSLCAFILLTLAGIFIACRPKHFTKIKKGDINRP